MKAHYSTFKDCHKGEAMLVVANGPSLTRMPTRFLDSLPSIACNRITMIFPAFCPNYYLALAGNHVNSPEKRETMMPMLDDLRLKAFFVNRLLGYEFDFGQHYDKVYTILGPRFYGATGDQVQAFSSEPLKYVGLGFSNVYPMLQLAYYFGAKTVYLVGLDHHYSDGPQKHFYRDGEGHTKPFEIAPGPYSPEAWKRGADSVFKKAREVYDKAGREIINLTPDSHCDIFEKKSLKEVWDGPELNGRA